MEIRYIGNKDLEKIDINFIHNRFDLHKKCNYSIIELKSEFNSKYLELFLDKEEAILGIWLVPITELEMKKLIKFIFNTNSKVKIIRYNNGYIPLGKATKKNHFKIYLPETEKELEQRLSSKGRYNIRREERLLNEVGLVEIKEYEINDVPKEVFDYYFKLKKITHNIDYNLDMYEYIEKFHVTNIYVMLLNSDKIIAIILSCEQCPIVYIENLTYDTTYSKLSPGQVLYDKYLKILVKKGFKEIFLEGGRLEYKRRYGSQEEIVYNGKIYRNIFSKYLYKTRKKIKRIIEKDGKLF